MRDRPLHVVVLAAGQGRRMRSALPKPLLPLAGRPLLLHVLEAAATLSPSAIHLVHGRAGEAPLRAAVGDRPGLFWVLQDPPLGTGHAVQVALPSVPGNARVLVLLGDVPTVWPELLEPLVEAEDPLAVLIARPADPGGYGRVLLDGDGRVRAVVEARDAGPEALASPWVNTGIIAASAGELSRWLTRLEPRNAQGEYYLTDVFALAWAEGRPARAFTTEDPLAGRGVNDAAELASLERAWQRRQAEHLLEQGVRLADPSRFDLRGRLKAGRDVEIDVDVILEGEIELGDGVRIGPFSRLRDCRLAAGSEVLAHCDLEGVVSEGACRIGPFARLRPVTRLAAGVQVGNFVEIKNSALAAGVKANHLSYLGDASIGEGSNIGAGTITCNYDGLSKHRTVIGARAFVGSNCSLVAPIAIGEEATIGAGSVLTKDAPAHALTLARAPQRSIPGWRRAARPRREPLEPREPRGQNAEAGKLGDEQSA